MEKEIVANHIAQVQKAIDVMATNPGMNLKQVGDEVGVTSGERVIGSGRGEGEDVAVD